MYFPVTEPLSQAPVNTPASEASPTPKVPASVPAPVGSLWSKVDETLQAIAYKVGRDDFGLSRGDFVIRYFPWRRHAYKVNRLGSMVRVYFGIFPLEPEFEFYLSRALSAVLLAVQTKGSKLAKYGEIEGFRKDLSKVAPHWDSLPKLAPRSELEVTEVYRVIVKHPASGIIVVKEAKHPKFGSMIIDARIEMAEALAMVEKMKEESPK